MTCVRSPSSPVVDVRRSLGEGQILGEVEAAVVSRQEGSEGSGQKCN
jgi:hypothetical protein